ncbi:hypothetical protein T4D_6560 [Trichinella pseudospiralis]|uniref:Uncharacterized protein n=1 Tax=Trichinella pseudospiralis TaxID=6337 RepID=A0A0V1FHJ4_TRIPS|nr:hypothetical protein T4D_6560 [Trichinella pseudospiralis]
MFALVELINFCLLYTSSGAQIIPNKLNAAGTLRTKWKKIKAQPPQLQPTHISQQSSVKCPSQYTIANGTDSLEIRPVDPVPIEDIHQQHRSFMPENRSSSSSSSSRE